MNNILTASILKITSKTRATSGLNGSLISNGGISCLNIYCVNDIIVGDQLNVKGLLTSDIIEVKNIKVSGNILPYNNVMSSIGIESMRWCNIYCNNLDVIGKITLGEINNSPMIEINDEIICNSNISFLNNNKQFLEMRNGVIKAKCDLYVNNILKIVGNSRVDVKGDIYSTNINISNYISIEPDLHTIDSDDYTLNIQSSIIIINIRQDTKLKFNILNDINNVIVKIIFINYGNYTVNVETDNREFSTDKGFDLFIVNNNKILSL